MYIPNGYANVQFVHVGQGAVDGEVIYACGFDINGDPDQGAVDDAGATYAQSTLLSDYISTLSVSSQVRVTYGTPVASEPIVLEGPVLQGGGATGQPVPWNTAILVKKVTNRGGRKGRGRMFLPPTQADAVDLGGLLQAGVADDVGTAVTELMTSIGTDLGGTPVLLHTLPGDGAPNQITNFLCAGKVATQRRRLRG